MKTTMLIVACACGCGVLWADAILVGVDDRVTVDVGAGETRTQVDPVVVKQRGTLDKTGDGTLVIPGGTLRDSTKFEMNVRGGTVEFPAETGATASFQTEPSVIRSKAALWLDANMNVDMDGDNVVGWRDVRETKTSTPFDYPRARSREYTAGNGYPWMSGAEGRRKVDFGGYKNGRYMAILDTGTDDSGSAFLLKDLRHVFLVHEILTNGCYALGYVNGRTPNGGLVFHPGDSSASLTKPISSPSDGIKSISGRFERNGLSIDPNTELPKTGLQLYDWHFIGAHNQSSNNELEGLACFSALCNGYQANRQGGGIICEVIAFKEWLTESERIAVAGYLMHKWGISSDAMPGKPTVHVAEGAVVSAPVDSIEMRGEGSYTPPADGSNLYDIPVDSLTNFHGTIAVPYDRLVRTREEMPLVAAGGDRLDVTNSFEGIVLSRYADQSYGTLVKDNIGGATLRAIPLGVTNLNVNGGILRLSPCAWSGKVSAGTNTVVRIANADFESATSECLVVNKSGSGEPTDSQPTYSNPCFSWYGEMWPTLDGLYPRNWMKMALSSGTGTYLTPNGEWLLVLCGQTYAYQTVEIPEDGVYELDFLAMDGQTVGGYHPVIEVAIGDEDGTPVGANMTVLAEVQSYDKRGWARYRYLTPRLKAGSHHLRIGNTEDTCIDNRADKTYIDDIHLTLVSRPSSGWAVPNGDFETLVRSDTLPTAPSSTATATGWTFTQTPWGNDATYLGALLVRYGSLFRCAATEFRHGETQLALVSGSSATVMFKPRHAGVYRLSGRVGKFSRGTYNGMATGSDPAFTVTIRQGETEAVSIGAVSASKRTFVSAIWPTDITFADTNTTVTMTIANTASTSIGFIDDLEFVPAHELREGISTIVKDGQNFSNAYWTFVSNRGDAPLDKSDASYSSNITGQYYGHNVYRSARAASVIDRGAIYQTVTFPAPGRYRLKWHSRARADVRDAAYAASFDYGKRSAIRVVLVDNGITNTVYECSTATTNFVGYSCMFNIADASRSYVLGFEGANDPRVSGVKDQRSYICQVSCDYIDSVDQMKVTMDMDPNLNIFIASGAKLELDYVGTNQIASVRIAGRRAVGVIDAARFPQYITGTGALRVKPLGLKVMFW